MSKTYLDFQDAIDKALLNSHKTQKSEMVNLDSSLKRVLSKDIFCIKNLPSFNNSAMDGFALKTSDAGKTLKVIRTIFAGESVKECLKENECYKIMTGAQVPSDVDTIVPIENVLYYENDELKVSGETKISSNLRFKGEETKVNNLLYKSGSEITSAMIAVLASQGIIMIEVYKKLLIAVLSTGNELIEPWKQADENEIYNCNSYALISLLKEKSFEATYIGVIPDSLEESINFIKELKSYDVIITSGGISMGDADYMAEAFKQNELDTLFHGVNIKPGRPIMMGLMNNTFVICLPGNPLTAMVNMHMFVIPILRKKQGFSSFYHDFQIAENTKEFKVKKGRVNVVLGSISTGEFIVTRDNKYGSGMITVLEESNSILVTSDKVSLIEKSSYVKVINFSTSYIQNENNIFN